MAGDHRDEGCNPCCCWNLKDGAVTIGIWSLVYAIASLFLFGWQTYVISSCQTVVMAQSNLQCEYYCPCVGASTKRTAAIIEGLFIIQILCLIAVFFLLFASIALIYGVHTWSRYLMFPWFICMISTILSSTAYCIMWWAGDVRDYWLALTILEIIGVIINCYCLVAVIVFYRRIQAETDYYEGKNRSVVYRSTRSVRSSRRDLLENQFDSYDGQGGPFPEHERIDRARHPQSYPRRPEDGFAPAPQPNYKMDLYNQQPYQPVLKAFPQQQPTRPPVPNPPYPIEGYEKEPSRAGRARSASTLWDADDPIGSWVKDQQDIALLSGGRRPAPPSDEANSEPAVGTPVRNLGDLFPLQHSRSVPSMYDDDDRRNGKRRSSSRNRHRSGDRDRRDRDRDRDRRDRDYRDRDRDRDRDDRDRRHKSRNRASSVGRGDYTSAYYSSESDTDFSRHRHGSRRRSGRSRDGRRPSNNDSDDDRTERSQRRRRKEDDGGRKSRGVDRERRSREEEDNPLAGGLTIPQHIVIPPSAGTRGPDGRLEPQKYQINSEIVIKYDKDNDGSVRVEPAGGTSAYNRRAPLPTPTAQQSRIQSTF